ncbi:MAG TPA: TonB-dependent receptor [Steroidobacteraceae bacterium]|nr:TonB-dependent receptor [Steroidobacteraceae bacterium]
MKSRIGICSIWLVTSLGAVGSPCAQAADTDDGLALQEIIVTAQKRAEDVQVVPISMSVLTGDELQQDGDVRIEDFAGLVPNLMVDSSNSLRSTAVSIRGILSDPNNVDIEPAVGVYVDGIYMDRPTTINSALFDLERVEILRGPQGTIFGKNTIGGAIDFVSKKPTQQEELEVTADYGNYDDRRLQVIANTPLITDVLAARVAFQYERRNGFLENLAGPDNNDANNINGRISVAYTPSDALNVILRVDGSRDRTHDEASVILVPSPLFAGPPFNSPQNVTNDPFDRIIRDSPSPFENRDVLGASLEADWNVASGTLTSLTAWRGFRWANYQSDDMTVFDIFGTGIDENQHQWSQELRYASDPNLPVTFVAGAYADQQGEDARAFAHEGVDVFAPFGAPLGSNPAPGEGYIQIHTHDRSYAAFAQADWHIDPNWIFTTGYRYTQQEKGITQYLVGDPTGNFVPTVAPQSYTRTDIDPSYNASLKYLFTEHSMAYLTFSHGFKAGGFNAFSFGLVQSDGQVAEFAPEHVNNFELGTKSTFADGRIRLDADVFYMNYRDLQVNSLIQNASGIIDFVTSNAARARSEGVELELQARVSAELEASLSYGYTDAIFTSYPGATPTGGDFTGHTLALSPRNSIGATLDYTHPLSSSWNLIGRSQAWYRSSRFSDPDNSPALEAPAYTVVNARVGAAKADGSLRVELWARNLLNRDYVNDRSFGSSAFSPGSISESIGDPRTYGIEFSYHWLHR